MLLFQHLEKATGCLGPEECISHSQDGKEKPPIGIPAAQTHDLVQKHIFASHV